MGDRGEFWCDCCEEEVDCNVVSCHECGSRICVDNCVGSTNDEHGLDFCVPCTEMFPGVNNGEETGPCQ